MTLNEKDAEIIKLNMHLGDEKKKNVGFFSYLIASTAKSDFSFKVLVAATRPLPRSNNK